MNKLTTAFLLLFITIFSISALDKNLDYLSASNRNILYTDGEIYRYFFDKELPEYLFDTSFKNNLLSEISKKKITIGVESLFLLKYNDSLQKNDIDPLLIYNTLQSVKTMKGIQYYSQTRKKMRTLYTESYGVSSPDTREALDDPVYKTIPSVLNRYLLQTDKTFGKNVYKTVYKYDGATIWVNMVNETKLKYAFLPMVDPKKMDVSLLIRPVEDGILFYGVSTVEISFLPGLAKSNKESFYNRINAMYQWFSNQLLISTAK